MRKIRIFATFPFELLHFVSRKTLEIDCFGTLPYPHTFLLLSNFVIFINELGSHEEGLLACGRSRYLQHFPLSYYILKVEKL